MEMICDHCRFMDDKSRCRRHAPKPVLSIDSENDLVIANWPSVNSEDWCGDFKLHHELKGEG